MLNQGVRTVVKVGPAKGLVNGQTIQKREIPAEQIFISRNGEKMTRRNEASPAKHDALGVYDVVLSASDVEQRGYVVVYLSIPGAGVVSEKFSVGPYVDDKKPIEAIATNLRTDEDGYAKLNPKVSMPLDLSKILNADTNLSLPNVSIGQVDNVARPHKTDLEPVMDAIRRMTNDNNLNKDAVVDLISSIIKDLKKLNTDSLNQKLLGILSVLKDLANNVGASKITTEDIKKAVKTSLGGIAKSAEIDNVCSSIGDVLSSINELDIPTVKDFGGPIKTKDGKVYLASGDGGVKLTDGMVHAKDVQDRDGYSLGRDAFGSARSSIVNELKAEIRKLQPPSPQGKKVAIRSGH